MSHREALSLAHTAECKLKIAANRPDRNLRFLLGHALTLDSVNLRLMQIEEENRVVRQPKHASAVRFRAADGTVNKPSPLSGRSKSPPPVKTENYADQDTDSESDSDDLALTRHASGAAQPPRHVVPKAQPMHEAEGYADEDTDSESDSDGLALTRHASGAAQPPRHVAPKPPQLEPDIDGSSSEDEELAAVLEMLEKQLDRGELEKITQKNPDESLVSLYDSIRKCSCHQSEAPEVKKVWELPKDQMISGFEGFGDRRLAVAEVGA